MTGWLVDAGSGTTLADTAYETFPDMVCLPDGKLIATWSTQADHYTPGTGKMRTSADGGVTWTPEVTTVTDTAMTNLGNRVARLNINTSLGTRRPWFYLSNDGGVTWQPGKEITGWGNSEWIFPADLAWHDDGTSDGLLLCTVYGPEGVRVMGSEDAGTSWDFRAVAKQGLTWSDATESCTLMLPNGDLIMLLRNDTTGNIERLTSTDQGYTWTAPTVVMANMSGMPRMTHMPDGTILATLRDNNPATTPTGAWSMGISTDQGETWLPWRINDEWMMYGRFVILPDDTALLIGASQQRTSSTRARTWVRTVEATTGIMVNATPRHDPLMVDLDLINIPTPVTRILVLDGTNHHRITEIDVAGSVAYHPDYTAPAGEATYLVRTFNTAGALLEEVSVTVATPEPPSSHVWLSDPLDETSPVLVPMMIEGDRERPRHANVAVARTLGGRTITSTGPRVRGVWQIVIKAETPAMIHQLQTFIDTASSVLIRAGSEMFLPGRLYGALPDAVETLRLYGNPPVGYWTLDVQPDDGPGIDPVISTWTWENLENWADANDITWESLGDTYPTWLELERGPVGGGD